MDQREVGVTVRDSGRDSDQPDAEPEMTAVNLNKLPLLPTERCDGLLSALDHSPVIRETLRDYLELDVETLGIGIADSIKQEYAQRFEEINRAEEEIMKVQAINMRILDDFGENGMLCDPREKKCDLSEDTARKFNLIRFEDIKMDYNNILFHKAVDDNHLNCPLNELDQCGPHISKERLGNGGDTKEKKGDGPKQKKSGRSNTVKSGVKKEDECCRHRLGFYDLGVTPLHNKWDDADAIIITMEPRVVTFENQKVGQTYIKKVKLNNVSNRLQKFEIRLDEHEVQNEFDIMFSKPMIRHFSLAPGIHMYFYVKFKCSDLDDHLTAVFVDIIDGRGFVLPVATRRLTPTLISEKFFFPSDSAMPEFKKSSAITVDCGTRFLGTKTEVTAALFNVGSDANYYVTTEENWELGVIPDIKVNNTFSFSYFTVTPVLFHLEAGSKVNLNFTFTPICERLFTEKLIILCDNYGLRSIDVIGEAVLFDPTHFCINANSKTFDVDEEDLYDAVQCVDFGIIKKNSSATKEIRFKSECPVEVDFHWELRQLPNWPEGYDIKAHQLTFSPNVGTLCALTTEEMEITCSTTDMPDGIHKSALCFVAKNVPKKCLIRDDIPGQQPQTEDLLMIDLMYVELRVTVAGLQIELDPPIIIFRGPRFNSQKYKIKAKNMSPWIAKVEWVLPESSIIEYSIKPSLTTTLPESSTRTFDLELKGLQMGTIEELLKLECSDDDVCFHLSVRGEVINPDPPGTAFLCHDIGPELPGSDVSFEIPILVHNLAKDYPFISTEVEACLNFDWKRGDDLTYKRIGTETGFIPILPDQVPYSTKLEKYEGTDLRLTSVQMEAATMEFYTDTIALVQDVDVVLDKTEVDLGSDFYQRVPIKTKVTLINRNQLNVGFEWQPPAGPDARHFVVEYEPKQGRLERLGRQIVDITLTADRPGNFDGLILPCAMERNLKTLYLTFNGVSKDVTVQISYPYKEDFVRINWPKVPTTLLNVSEDLDMKDERCCICFISKFPEVDVPQYWGEGYEPKILQFTDSNVSLPPYENWPVVGGMYYQPKFKDGAMRREFYHSWEPEDLKRRMITLPMEEKSDLIKAFSQHALVFHINTYQTGNSQTIMIENLTPIHTRYDLEVQEFVECGQTNLYKDKDNCNTKQRSRESLVKLLGGEEKYLIDELCSNIQPNAGLSLSLNNGNGQLRPSEKVAIDVTAFANCWGVYFDHIVIRIPELPPAIIPVLVVVEGPPVWFTMAPPLGFKAPRQDPTIRFHDVLSMSSAKQTVFVYNDSFLPVKLAWTTYVQRPPNRSEIHLCLPEEPQDFSVNLELHPTADDSFGQIHFTNGYGDVDSFYYDVEPRVMYLEPKQMKPLLVKVNTKGIWFNLNHLVNFLKGAAHAYVYLEDNENNNQKFADGGFSVYRPDGPRLDPLVLRMETKIAISTMRVLNNESTIFLYHIHSYDVTKTNKKMYTEERVYFFQNASDTVSEVKFDTTGHLRIRSAKMNGETHIPRGWDVKVIVRPGDIVELTTELTVTEGDLPGLLNAPTCISGKRYTEEGEHPLTTLVISHREAIQQVIPIPIVVLETKIQLSVTSLDFGEVFLNDSKGLSVTVTCPFGEEAYTCKVVSGYRGVFRVTPESGIVSRNKYVSVDVIFTPRECLNYYGMLMVTPSIESMGKVVLIFGKGSWDYKNHQIVSL